MTTVTKTPVTFLAAASGAAGTSKASPGASSGWIDTGSGTSTAADGGDMGLSITNGSSAPGVAPTLLVQWSPDNGVTVYDYQYFGGDVNASSINTTTVWIDPAIRYVRVIGYGNTTNAVTFGATFSGVTRA
jgi:hypothetical protein